MSPEDNNSQDPLAAQATHLDGREAVTVTTLTTELGRVRKYAGWLVLMGGVLVLDIVLSIVVGYVSIHNYQFRNCMEQWATDFTARSKTLDDLGRALRANELVRITAVDRLLVDQSQKPPAPRQVVLQDYRMLVAATTEFEVASAKYTRVIATVPVPEAPHCGAF